MSGPEFSPAPERHQEGYGRNAAYNQKRCYQLAQEFFKDAVRRARERHERQEANPLAVISLEQRY